MRKYLTYYPFLVFVLALSNHAEAETAVLNDVTFSTSLMDVCARCEPADLDWYTDVYKVLKQTRLTDDELLVLSINLTSITQAATSYKNNRCGEVSGPWKDNFLGKGLFQFKIDPLSPSYSFQGFLLKDDHQVYFGRFIEQKGLGGKFRQLFMLYQKAKDDEQNIHYIQFNKEGAEKRFPEFEDQLRPRQSIDLLVQGPSKPSLLDGTSKNKKLDKIKKLSKILIQKVISANENNKHFEKAPPLDNKQYITGNDILSAVKDITNKTDGSKTIVKFGAGFDISDSTSLKIFVSRDTSDLNPTKLDAIDGVFFNFDIQLDR